MSPLPAPRPSVLAEVRAWALAAVAVFVHTVGIVWWAATLSADFRGLKDLLVSQQASFLDHEQRLRSVENSIGIIKAEHASRDKESK